MHTVFPIYTINLVTLLEYHTRHGASPFYPSPHPGRNWFVHRRTIGYNPRKKRAAGNGSSPLIRLSLPWLQGKAAIADDPNRLDLEQCVLNPDREFFSESDWMEKRLKQMKQMPSAFVCANDFIAVNVMKALKNNHIAIPGDIAVCGFDNAPESRIVEPHLSTVHIYSDEMGIAAANMLLSRVKEPALPYQVTHIQTKPLFRASTEKTD